MSRLVEMLKREWDERIHEGETSAPSAFPEGDHVGGVKAHYKPRSYEDTRTWGNSCPFTFQVFNDETFLLPTPQLVHVLRGHPTTYTVLTVVDLVSGWEFEAGTNWQLTGQIYVGVGQAQVLVKRVIPIPPGQIANGAQFIDVFTVPAHAIQCAAVLGGTSTLINPGPFQYSAKVTQLIAPVVM